jgi:hypothetical protein
VDRLALKWGSLKDWSGVSKENEAAQAAIEKFFADEVSMSAMMQRNTDSQKDAICELIDALSEPCLIYNDWSGEDYTKEQAKEYVRDYDRT